MMESSVKVKTEENTTNVVASCNLSSSSPLNSNTTVKLEGCRDVQREKNDEASSSSSSITGNKGPDVTIDVAATEKNSCYNTAPAASNPTSQKRKGKNTFPATKQGDVENGLKLWKKQCTLSILDKEAQEVSAIFC